jgi:dihydropteroate synthase
MNSSGSRAVAGFPKADRCLVMGVVNVTPDSFSDGGRWTGPGAGVEHGLRLLAEGADLVDVGGESTRPGAQRPAESEELARIVPVVRDLVAAGVPVSIDTMRAGVAAVAIEMGATLVNDVSGGMADPDLLRVVAEAGCGVVLMHWREHAARMQDFATYDDVVSDVVDELRARVDAAVAAGVDPARVAIDPGLGFAKTAEHNWALLQRLGELDALGLPLLVGASRKGFLGELLADDLGPRPVDRRDAATTAVTTLVAEAGAWCVRVHDVRASADAVRVVERCRRG